jgi:hypothetical protein
MPYGVRMAGANICHSFFTVRAGGFGFTRYSGD